MFTIKNFVQLRFIFFFLFFLSFTNLFSQDTIVFNNGQKTLCKVIEVGINEIKYKEFSNPEGPLYIKEKSSIKEIIYKNGTIESFNLNSDVKITENSSFDNKFTKDIITSKKTFGGKFYYQNNILIKNKNDFLTITESNYEAYNYIKKSIKYRKIGMAFGITSGALMGGALGWALGGNEMNWKIFGWGAVGIPFGFVYAFLSDALFAQGIEIYNNSLLQTSIKSNKKVQLDFSSNNFGLVLKF